MRMLSREELELVSGGCTSSDCLHEDDEVVVTGTRIRWVLDDLAWYSSQGTYTQGDGFAWGNDGSNVVADTDSIDVTVNIPPGDLTTEQKAAIEALKASVVAATAAINALPDTAKIVFPNGATITGAELKELWAKTDFVINPEGHQYLNGTDRGEADRSTSQISFNLDKLVDYYRADDTPHTDNAGTNFLVLHELGHLTAANTTFDENANNPQTAVERMANDIARAIAHSAGLDFLSASETIDFSTLEPMTFTEGSGHGGGGGDSGGNGDYIP